MNLNRFITTLYLVLFVGFGLTASFLFLEARGEYNRLKQAEALNHRRLSEARTRLDEQEKILERLRTDPAYVERVIRNRLGYVKPDEIIFRFPELP
ncbi:MAG TPA: septum formation initiator family protein [Opitutaceae bacterium]|nr:septum formation initiator family protein [Opitutaceae bacterium]